MRMKANYHTHSRWCKHGVGEIEDFVEVALGHGFQELAITEHVPHRSNADAYRLQWEEFPAFDKALNKAKESYKDKIRLIKGFECEYFSESLDDYRIFREEYGYELFILGHHRSNKHREIDNFRRKGTYELALYADEVCEGLETGLFNFLAHPDLILLNYPTWDKHAETCMRQIFSTCERLNIPVEINGNGCRDDRGYPYKNAFLLSKEYNLNYLINTDAHEPEHMAKWVIEKVEGFADSVGIREMPFLKL